MTVDHASIATELARARARTLAICDQQTEADQQAQHSPLMSPMVWDLAHIGNYEELWLVRALGGGAVAEPGLDDLYDAFAHPRRDRPALPILGPAAARDYIGRVRDASLAVLEQVELTDSPFADPTDRRASLLSAGFVYGMVLQHEHQHCETLLATAQLMGEQAQPPPGTQPPPPTSPGADAPGAPGAHAEDALAGLVTIDGGAVALGTDAAPWAYDNERPGHVVEVAPFAIGRHPVTNRQWRAFVDDGGYDDVRHWSADGWAWRKEADLTLPQFWARTDDGMSVLRYGERLDLDELADQPVQHVCFHEAEAFCRWAGGRLPTEAEWEVAARWDPATGDTTTYPWGEAAWEPGRANLGQRFHGPAAVGSYPAGVSATGVWGLLGDVWEWTSSTFTPYPGFASFPYDEYSAVFFGSDYRVLRGGSWGADPLAVRGTFRNWDYPIRRQIFCGLRVARDV